MDWKTTLPEGLARKLVDAGWPKDDQRIRNMIIGIASSFASVKEMLDHLLEDVPLLTKRDVFELRGWAETLSPSKPANPSKSGMSGETGVSRDSSDAGNTGQSVEARPAIQPKTDAPSPAPATQTFTEKSAPTVACNTEHCLWGVLRALETESACSGLASPTRTVASKGGGWQSQGKGGRGRTAGRKGSEGSGSETDARRLSETLPQVRLLDVPPPKSRSIDPKLKVRDRHVDWSCSMDVVEQMEREREGTHCVSLSLLAENFGPHKNVTSFRGAIKRVFRGLVSVATGTLLQGGVADLFSVPLSPRPAGWNCMSIKVNVHSWESSHSSRSKPENRQYKFAPEDIGVEGEQKILTQVQGLRDLFGGHSVYVSSEDWSVLSAEVRKVRPLENDDIWQERLSSGLPPMYLRIARGVFFDKGHRESLSDFDVSKFVPTSAAPGGTFAERVREYFRVNYHEAGPGGRPLLLTTRKS
uniref:Uncharacterized protein n=1 Tax=Chromera velia CCMP2878 TaxID=1169474 RepID=A0A0G4FNU9_9ALVE|eukprot:Cvel_17972.t1-p1 / transcript=Cvel_17972.t1 / gene=Cvel_17972 / organism=Chromera_velia_CCMP2878 / gene_product=hypothetical protein / transcript_product=hypothetical protein / location=Cvel_scaffold1463:22561-23973(-) / protein_length=471 / sequence_SO=supercontig / SO=protein_coding / is_pseudo=false